MYRMAHLCPLLLLLFLLPLFHAAPYPPCLAKDYVESYTECHADNTRDVVWYLRPNTACNVTTGYLLYTPPSPIYGLPCSVSCAAGYYLPMGEVECASCKEGTFSIGGGYRADTWYTWPAFFQFTRYYFLNTDNNAPHNTAGQNLTENSPQWYLSGGVLRSGHINDSQTSVLEMTVYIVSSTGHVTFSYRVNAEHNLATMWDALTFQVDSHFVVNRTSYVPNYVKVTYPLSPGVHVLRWSYSKDSTFSRGEDAAFIRTLEIGGLNFADETCTPCPEGTFNEQPGSSVCDACPANTYANSTVGAYECLPCAANEYSYSEAASCRPRPNCTANDWEMLYSPCSPTTGLRSLDPAWLTPIICDTTKSSLPPSQTNLPCGDCTAGATRNTTTHQCDYCSDGTYSTGGAACQVCGAGTAAIKVFAVTQFNDPVPGSSTDCSGECSGQGWVLHSTYMDSGVGHGENLNSWFVFNTTLVAKGTITVDYTITCPSEECNLQFSTNPGKEKTLLTTASISPMRIDMDEGTHMLNWTFSKFGYANNRDDRATITRISITHTKEGGAITCTKCDPGYVSSVDSTFCTACKAGEQSNQGNTACMPCPEGYHNPNAGSVCLPCGNGTSASADRKSCVITCKYNDGVRQYDLNPLKNESTTYGPVSIAAKPGQLYYINVCGMSPDVCYATKDTFIHSYACQQTSSHIQGSNLYEGMDIGSIMGWSPLPNNTLLYKTDLGVMMDMKHGTPGCAASYGNVAKPREAHVAFVCDPTAGFGYPAPNDTNIEGPVCAYNFIWRSLYACPICDPKYDYGSYFSPCQQGQRTKTYYWIHNPPRCTGGQLPEPEVVSCSESTLRCKAGTFLSDVTNQCVGCAAGSYSVGGGEHIMNWVPLPPRFTNNGFVPGIGGIETIASGTGTTTLTATFNYVALGAVNFQYKLYSNNPREIFTFIINNEEKLNIKAGTNRLGWTSVGIALPAGFYQFAWRFTGGAIGTATTSRAGVVLKGVTFVGTDWHDDACTPCPAGFHSPGNASSCTACAVGHTSLGDASSCTACPPGYTALQRSGECVEKRDCTDSDWTWVYEECTGTTRYRYAVYLDPHICEPIEELPMEGEVPCAACPPGTYREGASCSGCPAGQVYTDGDCKEVSAGSMALSQKQFFLESSEMPSDWSTSCSGDCGSPGWRILTNGALDSGYHSANAVDALLRFGVHVGDFASISFRYEITSSGSNGLDFYVNGVFVKTLRDSGVFSSPLNKGGHNITWDYYQYVGGEGKAKISEISVSGILASNVGAESVECPMGSSSANDGSTMCTPCTPGSFAANTGSTTCDPCEKASYTSEYGASSCKQCNGGTYTEGEGATYCKVDDDCLFSSIVKARNIDFSLDATDVVGPIRGSGPNTFFFNFCNASLMDAPCDPHKPTHACAVEGMGVNAANRNWGEDFNFIPMHDTSQEIFDSNSTLTFAITFKDGDDTGCPTGVKRSMEFRFHCDVGKGVGTPTPVSSSNTSCVQRFDWVSIMGCPVCQAQDYATVYGPCVDGMKTAQRVRLLNCNGKEVESLPSQSCSGTVEFPLGVVFVVIAIILVLIVVAVIVFIKNRKISAQYSRLKMQGAGAGGELDQSSDTIHTL